jgi:ribose transport system substrate-binding protein
MRKALRFIFAITVLLPGCQRGADTNSPSVGLVLMTLNNPFFVDMQSGAEEAATRLGVNLIVQAPDREMDVEKQLQIVENLIQRRVDAICIAPSGSKEIIPAIVKANAANIPVLIVDARIDEGLLAEAGGKIATYIGSDNFEGGRLAGEHLAKLLNGNGRIAILEGIPGHETGDKRLWGFHAAIDSATGIEVVASQSANWMRDQGFNVFQNILESQPEVDGMFAVNDIMALGAVEAIELAGRTGEILVIGFDAVDDAREAIRAGRMAASIAQHPAEMGRLAVENAIRVVKGGSIPEYVAVKIELITNENVDN